MTCGVDAKPLSIKFDLLIEIIYKLEGLLFWARAYFCTVFCRKVSATDILTFCYNFNQSQNNHNFNNLSFYDWLKCIKKISCTNSE